MLADFKAGDWRRPAAAVLILASIAMAILLLAVGRWLTFFADEWPFLVTRQNGEFDLFFRPYVDAWVLVPTLVYYVLLHTFGMTSYYPYLIVDWTMHFVCVVLLARVVSRRSGVLLGLMSGLSLLFLGTAFEDLLQPFQMQYLFSAAAGLAAINLLDRPNPSLRRVIVAAVALIVGVTSSGFGPIMAALVAIYAILAHQRAWLYAALPALGTYGIWYVASQSQLSRIAGMASNLPQVPAEVAFGIGASISAVLGLPPERFAWLGLGFGIGLLALAAWRRVKPTPLAVAAIGALVIQNLLQAVFRGAMGFEHGARSGYLYPEAIFLWLALAGWLGPRLEPARWAGGRRLILPALVGVLIVPMALGNMFQFVGAARASRGLRALELREIALMTRLRDSPSLTLDAAPDPFYLSGITARRWFELVDRFGDPQVAADRPGDDLPGPDAAALNAVASRLLFGAITVTPDGKSATTRPSLVVASGATDAGDTEGCTRLATVEGEADATWSPGTSGLGLTTDGRSEISGFLGLFAPVEQPMDASWNAALGRGDTIWLPSLPETLRWQVRVRVTGDGVLYVCNRERP